ncbi:MAG: biotin--[acetyl-CoA-carboxylase] ligase [Clostridiales bacterium]|nr:biotin--[acetyl-CoA-carboxylase] ligase [Clostridiales bacterium]
MTELQSSIKLSLEEARGEYITGEYLAARYGVTRAAVCKAVAVLRSGGIQIEAHTRRGYRLPPRGILSAEGILKYLRSSDFYDVRYSRTVTSTNSILKGFAAQGAPEGTALAASEQTSGRGRFGRSFISRPDRGIYISFIIRPKGGIEDAMRVTSMAAVAVSSAIEEVSGRETQIKWVNDIYISGKKAVGILTEGAYNLESASFDSAVVGIGVNILPQDDLPPELKGKVGSVYGSREESDSADAPNRIAAALLDNFREIYLSGGNDYMEIYCRKSMVLGKEITVYPSAAYGAEASYPARAVDIDDKARLLVVRDSGESEWLSGGEVSVRL